MEGFNSPSPQPEDPRRFFDARFEEDLDIIVELVNGTFYQATCDGASVDIVSQTATCIACKQSRNLI